MTNDLRRLALRYHSLPIPGKTGIKITKPTATQTDLSLCYTPGVAEPVLEIAKNALTAYQYTNKANLVAIITNGTAVLGLGNVGALASKPVMEGKSVLLKYLADIDAFDIEVDAEDPEDFIETVIRISPTFGAINLEDIKAPECFIVERKLREVLPIPVFHDDQHGTAIVITAGLLNALEVQNKQLADVKIVCAGAGAAGITTVDLLIKLGATKENILLVDRGGVLHHKRHDLNSYKQRLKVNTPKRSLTDALVDADVFIGVSGPDIITADMLLSMAAKPILFALSNPNPEIQPDLALRVRTDCVLATGRSDFPNQVNNAVCFPYIFRGALDVRAKCINEAMQIAAVHAIKELARESVIEEVLEIYNLKQLEFGAGYILPTLMDQRLKARVSSAVAKAAVVSGVAQLEFFTNNAC